MSFTQCINTSGEHQVTTEGLIGPLDAILSIPETPCTSFVALLGHPHSLQGGTMNNKVVTTLARVCKELNIPSLRFNFRGVGRSAGHYDGGLGESDDMRLLAQQWAQQRPNTQFLFAGFSFGSYVAYRAAAQVPKATLITIAPPVHHYNYHELAPALSDWLVIQGDKDEVVPYSLVQDFVKEETLNHVNMITLSDTSHFFHGKLVELKAQLIEFLKPRVGS